VEELARMFPDIPRPYLVRELDRAEGTMSVAIEALLGMNERFAGSESSTSLVPEVPKDKAASSHRQIVHEVEERTETSDAGSTVITRRNWDTLEASRRREILAERKRIMLRDARNSFFGSKQ